MPRTAVLTRQIRSRTFLGSRPTYRGGSDANGAKPRRFGHLTRPGTLFRGGSDRSISNTNLEKDVVDFSLTSLTSIEFQQKENE